MTPLGPADTNGPDEHTLGGGDTAFVNEDLSGIELAGCQLVRKIGQGAMGAVYLANQESLRRTVAIKVLDPKFSRDVTYIERFEREAQAAARLAHFNIVQVFDYGRSKEIYYIVNEYVDGGDVQELIDAEGVLSPEQAVDIAFQACKGMAVAQRENVIHRDIKPENLMLTKGGVVKIADFGLAKVITDDAAVTQSGMIVGTPFYMSPEQAKGQPLDSRSDIYSLGISLFHMVTGQIPFDADSVIGVLLKQISGERPDPVGINPSVPTDLGKTIMRMMSKSQEERFQSFDELIEVLQQHKRDLACGTRKVQIEVPDTPVNRRDRYKILRKEHIVMMRQRKVSSEAARQMLDMLKSDAGIFVEAKEPFAENSIIEIRFTVAGRDDIFRGIGVVRWVDMSGLSQGMGITFLKVSLMPAASSESGRRLTPTAFSTPETPAVQPQRKLSPAETIRKLSQTPLHCRLLRYYYANSGQSVQLQQIASALGVGTRMLADILATYESMGMLQRHTGGLVDFIWPDERGLQREIVAWVSKYGLM